VVAKCSAWWAYSISLTFACHSDGARRKVDGEVSCAGRVVSLSRSAADSSSKGGPGSNRIETAD